MRIRGAWLAAKVGKPLISLMKPAYNTPSSDLQMIDAGLALSAIGHTHRKLQSEIGKLLGQTEHLPEGKFGEFVHFMHQNFSAHYQLGVDKPEVGQAYLAHAAQQVMEALAKRYGGPAGSERIAAALSPAARDLGVTFLLQAPFPRRWQRFSHTLGRIALAARLRAPQSEKNLHSAPESETLAPDLECGRFDATTRASAGAIRQAHGCDCRGCTKRRKASRAKHPLFLR